jgi:hypothetical protein
MSVPLGDHIDATAVGGVSRSVVEQIREYLREPHRVGMQVDRLARQKQRQSMPGSVDERAAGFGRAVDDRRERNDACLQLQSVLRDSADVQQIVEQPGHVPDLALDDVPRPGHSCARQILDMKNLDGIPDRGQRIAQLVREGGEELVLAVPCLAQLALVPLALRDVGAEPRHSLGFAVPVQE